MSCQSLLYLLFANQFWPWCSYLQDHDGLCTSYVTIKCVYTNILYIYIYIQMNKILNLYVDVCIYIFIYIRIHVSLPYSPIYFSHRVANKIINNSLASAAWYPACMANLGQGRLTSMGSWEPPPLLFGMFIKLGDLMCLCVSSLQQPLPCPDLFGCVGFGGLSKNSFLHSSWCIWVSVDRITRSLDHHHGLAAKQSGTGIPHFFAPAKEDKKVTFIAKGAPHPSRRLPRMACAVTTSNFHSLFIELVYALSSRWPNMATSMPHHHHHKHILAASRQPLSTLHSHATCAAQAPKPPWWRLAASPGFRGSIWNNHSGNVQEYGMEMSGIWLETSKIMEHHSIWENRGKSWKIMGKTANSSLGQGHIFLGVQRPSELRQACRHILSQSW